MTRLRPTALWSALFTEKTEHLYKYACFFYLIPIIVSKYLPENFQSIWQGTGAKKEKTLSLIDGKANVAVFCGSCGATVGHKYINKNTYLYLFNILLIFLNFKISLKKNNFLN